MSFSSKKSESTANPLVSQLRSQKSLSPYNQRRASTKKQHNNSKNGVKRPESGSSSDGSGEEHKIMLGGSSTVGPWHHDYSAGMSSGIDGIDEFDGSQPQESRSTDTEEQFVEIDEQKAHLINKIERIKEKLKAAHKTQQADVDEFLKVTADIPNTADNPQLMRIRQVFEKKNRKSTQLIQALQKKMENYHQRLKNLDSGPIVRRGKGDNMLSNVGQGLKDVGANIKESITGYTGTMISVPKDLAHKLLKKSGSADNIAAVSKADINLTPNNHLQAINSMNVGSRSVQGSKSIFYTNLSDDRRNRTLSESILRPLSQHNSPNRQQSAPSAVSALVQQQPHLQHVPGGGTLSADEQSLLNSNLERFYVELTKIREEMQKIQTTMDDMRAQTQQEYAYFHGALHEEKYRAQRLEDQINDQAELHQAEVTNLRQEIQNLEGRLTYQVNSRMQDMHDDYGKLANEVSALKSRIKEVQQFIGMEGFEGMSLRAKCRRGVMLLAQFFADLLLWIVSLLNAQHVKAMITILLFAFIIYHVGGFIVWNVLYSAFRYFIKKNNSSASFPDNNDTMIGAATT